MPPNNFFLMIINNALGSYVYHREGRFAGKFFCIPHSTENALEKYKFKTKVSMLLKILIGVMLGGKLSLHSYRM